MACRYLHTGEISSAIIASSNLYLSPEHVMDTGPIGMAHSPTGRCLTFDAKADGYIKAEAVNAIVMKRLDDAIQDRDPIRAVIRGSATNSDGRTPGIASPNSDAQAAAVRSAYANAGIADFGATSYLECHGTGTPAGDPLEVLGVSSVFADSRTSSAPLIIGSIKSNLGHSEPAAGLSGLFKAILAIEHGVVPGNPTFTTPNPNIDFEQLKIRATRTATLDKHLSSLDVKVKLRDLAYTLSERRSHHFHRGYIVAKGSDIDCETMVQSKNSVEQPRIGFVFTGQGAQWSQMGKAVVDTFPSATLLLERLDSVLQQLPSPPSWSLLHELTEPRTGEHLRQPEFSQPLITALQLVLLGVLGPWGIQPQSVVGHSSGEIAAACAAGYISEEDAIKAAFFRGQSAKNCKTVGEEVVGMLAVGLGPSNVIDYLSDVQTQVQIACYNSPRSVTLSGTIACLEDVKERLVKDGHFARLLQVDLAYHSKYMARIRDNCEAQLEQNFKPLDRTSGSVEMSSSVHGQTMSGSTDARYWKANMTSAVKFEDACREMLAGRNGADFLIEIGPSAALAGPISQIKESLGAEGSKVQYCAALGRGADSIDSLFRVAGKLFISGAPVALSRVNNEEDASLPLPCLIIDLPNYSWNHNNKHRHESQASKDWSFRSFLEHDLLGTKVLAAPWHAPSFRKTLLLERLPWLRDHKMRTDFIFPASGYIAMAIEAIYQTHTVQHSETIRGPAGALQYHLRDIKFDKALVIEEGTESKVSLALNPLAGTKDTWHEFRVSSSNDGTTTMHHCTGLVRVEGAKVQIAEREDLAPLLYPTPAQLWYKAQTEVGYGFGPDFRKLLQVETVAGQRKSRSTISLAEPKSGHEPQSPYPIHPASIDSCFQSVTPSLWGGERATINAVLVPAIMDNIVVYPRIAGVEKGLTSASSEYTGRGRLEEAKSFSSACSVFDPASGDIMLKMDGLRYHKLDTGSDMHTYNRTIWRPDVTFLSQDQLYSLAQNDNALGIQQLIDLITHKKPAVKVLDASCVAGDTSSLWFSGGDSLIRWGYDQYSFVSSDAKALIGAKEGYELMKRASFDLQDILKHGSPLPGTGYDLAILKVAELSEEVVTKVASTARTVLYDDAIILFLEQQLETVTPLSEASSGSSAIMVDEPDMKEKTSEDSAIVSSISNSGYTNVLRVPQSWAATAYVARAMGTSVDDVSAKRVSVMHLSAHSRLSHGLRNVLEQSDWQVTEHFHPYSQLQPKSIVLVLDEATSSVLSSISESQWQELRRIILQGNRLLWITEGSQMHFPKPENAMVHGMFRTLRGEDRSAELVTLDVEHNESPSTRLAVELVLRSLPKTPSKAPIDSEFVETGSIIDINRKVPDKPINLAKNSDKQGDEPVACSLKDIAGLTRLLAGALGTLDSLCYSELSHEELQVLENHIEVDIKAAGLNSKDVAVTMGIVPENEHLLGLEGSGVVCRVGNRASKFRVGDRIAFLKNRTFADKTQCPVERAHHIPWKMSFKDAATIPLAYLTCMYSLISQLSKGQSVLIHSAAGGVGLASIQLAQWVGAEIFVTVRIEEKRQFLHETHNIPFEQRFSSRRIDFAEGIILLRL